MTVPSRVTNRFPLAIALAGLAVALSACITPFDFAANAGLGIAQAGTSSFNQGTLQSAFDRSLEQAAPAARQALEKLGYPITREDINDFYATLQSQQSDGSSVTIKLRKSSERVTGISIRVGFWGDSAVSRLILAETERNLGISQPSATPAPPTPSSPPSVSPPPGS